MSSGKILCALDIGSSKIRAVMGELKDDKLIVLAVSEDKSEGVSHGEIVNIEKAGRVIKNVISNAELQAGREANEIIVSVGGTHISCKNSQGIVGVNGKDNEISKEDIRRSLDVARATDLPRDMELIHTLVQNFLIDGKSDIKDPLSMLGHRLESKVLLVLGSSVVCQNISRCVERTGTYKLKRKVLKQLADTDAVLTNEDKDLGVILINLGSETTDMMVYQKGAPLFVTSIDIGSNDITNDISLIFNRTNSISERVKIDDGSCYTLNIDPNDTCIIPSVGGEASDIELPRIELAKVIEARMGEIFSILSLQLEDNNINGNFGSGVVLVGGGSLLTGVTELAREIFKMNARIGFVKSLNGLDRDYLNPEYSTVLGLLISEEKKYSRGNRFETNSRIKYGYKKQSRFKKFLHTIF